MEVKRERILIVDDEANVRDSLKMILGRHYRVDAVKDGEEALNVFHNASGKDVASGEALPSLVLLDVMMPGIDGLSVLEKIKAEYASIPVIMLSASSTVRTAVQAMKIGAVDYLNKPYDVDELLSLISETLQHGPKGRVAPSAVHTINHIRPELPFIEGDLGSIVGKHPVMADLYKKIEQLAKRETTVLITGESGTGKELVAREIHKRSNRCNGPFVALNCAAIPETLIESELFGHEKGAFTHAVDRRAGHFELADGGTLLLDEVGELSLPVQVKMLRFLQEQEFYPVGRSKSIRVDVRILAATNRSLETAIKEGRFRQDLYYRINVINLVVPPLRERKEDIPGLVDYFVKRLSGLYGGKKRWFTDDAMQILCDYAWPGNVRELENVIESILALCHDEEIKSDNLPVRLKRRGSGDDPSVEGVSFEDAERAFEIDIIVRALEKSNYVQTKAAEILGISRRILKYKMDKLGILDKPQ